MPTDGADFKRRLQYHGKTYTEIKKGSDEATVASFSAAGLAREISGDNPLLGFREMVLAAEECLQGLFGRDRSCLLFEGCPRVDRILEQPSSQPSNLQNRGLIPHANNT